MCSDIARIEATITNATVAPHLWSDALALLAETLGAVGAAYFVSNKRVRHVDWTCLSGPSNELTLEFMQITLQSTRIRPCSIRLRHRRGPD
jgi:hypothetical protein